MEDAARFTLVDVLGDTWGSFRRTFFTHARWNLLFVCLAILVSCLVTCAMVPVVAALGGRSDGTPASALLAIGAVYLAIFVVSLAIYALHQGVTVAITTADLRDQPIELSAAIAAAARRLPSLTIALIARVVADLSLGAVLIGGAAALAIGARSAGAPGGTELALGIAILIAYPASFAWILLVRAFLGLSGPAVQTEELGGLAALGHSVRLLAGHRLKMLGLRLLWALAAFGIYVIAYLPLGVVVVALSLLGEDMTQGALPFVMFPYLLLLYFVILQMISFDSALEAAFHVRLTRPTWQDVARVFD